MAHVGDLFLLIFHNCLLLVTRFSLSFFSSSSYPSSFYPSSSSSLRSVTFNGRNSHISIYFSNFVPVGCLVDLATLEKFRRIPENPGESRRIPPLRMLRDRLQCGGGRWRRCRRQRRRLSIGFDGGGAAVGRWGAVGGGGRCFST